MKLLLTAFCAAMITSPLAFAGDKCEKSKCDKAKEEATIIAHCGKCGKECDGEKKCDKCKKRAEEAKDEGALIAGDKCKKKCDKEEEEATLLAGDKCKKKCDKEEEEATLA